MDSSELAAHSITLRQSCARNGCTQCSSSLRHSMLRRSTFSSFSVVSNNAGHAGVTGHGALSSNDERGMWCQWLETHLSRSLGVAIANLLHKYFMWYSAYLFVIIGSGAITMWLLDHGLLLLDAFYLATSAVTMTGLSSVDFGACRWTTHCIIWLLLPLGSPMLLSLVPLVSRRAMMLRMSPTSTSDDVFRMESMASVSGAFGLLSEPGDESLALGMVCVFVVAYWTVVQSMGWLALWCVVPHGAWPTLFLATSAFHNAGFSIFNLPLHNCGFAPSMLSIMMVLILCGNTCFPILLRVLLRSACYLCPRNGRYWRVLCLLLRFPRTCYTQLFPFYATRWLAVITPALVVMQIVALCLVDLFHAPGHGTKTAIMNQLPWAERALAVFFQSISTRTAGFSVLDMKLISPTTAFIFCACMWISVCPMVVVMRSTNRAERTTGYYTASAEQQQEKDAAILQAQLTGFMSQNSTMLLLLFFLILLAEEYTTSEHDVREHRFLFILFEFCSAYGTVGLSMSDEAASRSGKWSWPAKCSLMAVMFLGRLRGLPDSIDPAFHFGTLSGADDELEFVGSEGHDALQEPPVPQSLLL